jgi:hypothetical protein
MALRPLILLQSRVGGLAALPTFLVRALPASWYRHHMKTTLKGIIHGKVIELEQETGFPDGQEVAVTVEPVSAVTSPTTPEALAALRRAAGAWADDSEELDRYLDWNRQQRKGSRPEIPE